MLSPTKQFDPRGDLTILVGDGDTRQSFLVCAKSLARASDVWEKMLFGQFAESQAQVQSRGELWTVSFPADDPAAFRLLMHIIHDFFNDVPSRLSLDELLAVTVLTDKYNLTSALAPWASQWIAPFRWVSPFNKSSDIFGGSPKRRAENKEILLWVSPLTKSSEIFGGSPKRRVEDKEILLWVAWELGDKRQFKEIVLDFLMGSTIDMAGQLLLPIVKQSSSDPNSADLPGRPTLLNSPPGLLGQQH
ncbi:hypothetical protein F5Y15DRAFT_227802 [Xylariaceae sp. FL0016]|nr:hypothetical protein F5Y15DRAFT_227802 [Xylariaceae sp. FL0016]